MEETNKQMNLDDTAQQVSDFLGVPRDDAQARLALGFHHNHALVATDFTQNATNVNDEESLLNWYKNTDAYIWELAAYHLEEGFNYQGMCEGIAVHLKNAGKEKVLVLGDGIGTLSIRLKHEGLDTFYHDLAGSKTSDFARFRFNRTDMDQPAIHCVLTQDWEPKFGRTKFDAVVALDFFEHLPNVPEWAGKVFTQLKKGGVFMAQNAFAIGDAEHGNSIPMHLSVNNRFEHDWEPMLEDIGFKSMNNGWWQKP